MALEPGTWSNLKNQAKAGYLKFDTADALAAARACADLVDDLLGMAAAVTNLRLDNVAPIGNLTSGAQLAAAFTAKGSRLRTILKDHADIVKDMGETYIAAGKAYANAEGDAGNDFRALEKLAMPTEAGGYTPGARKAGGPDAEFGRPQGGFGWKDNDGKLHVHDAKAESFPSSLKDYQGEKDPGVTANIENKDSLAFRELYELGRDLDAAPVLAAAGTWHSMANDLLGKLNTFVTAIDTGTEAWEGQGATAAAAAVENYSEGVQPLVTSMIAMSQNLDYSAQWLYLTKLSMPSSPDPGDCCPGKVTRRYREEWQKHYGEGMKNTVSVMPVVHGPIAQPAPQGDPNRNQPGNNPPGDGRYGNGQYGNNQYGNGEYGNGRYGNGGGRDWDDPYGYGSRQQDPRYPSGYGQADPSLEYGDGTTRSDGDADGSGARGDRSGGSGAGGSTPLPNGASGGGSSGTQGQLPPGYEAARQDAESAAARAGGASTPVGSSGGGSAGEGATRSQQSGSGNPFPRSSLPGESSGSDSGSGEADVPGYSSLGSAPLPNGATGGSFGGGGSGSRSSGSGPGGSGAGGLEDALATAFDADPAQVRSMLDALPELLNEDALSRTSGLSPEQVRSVLENIPDVADIAELATLTGLDPAQVRSVLDNLPNALDEKALASATGTGDSSTSRAGLPSQPAGTDGGPASFAEAGKDFLGQIGKALTQGMGSLGDLGAVSAGADQLHEMLRRFDPDAIGAAAGDLPVDPAAGAGGGGSVGGAGGGEVGGAGTLSEHPTHQARTSQMFPRASLAGAEQPMYPAAAAAGPGANGMGGPPMMGPAGAGAGGGGAQGNTSHKPARYLQSTAHLDDAIGAVPDRVKPVIDS
ncbi:homeobox domain-containing protein [Nocardia higoensis]|uniref:Homeobox domain-containing protein n=1 Tax=Nocardia higoensis TaxID=228599 RepID=A0ABS0D3T1_9NOCA|nr:homeobox domain-containing protein [Nocardia higoensis]MBF6353121.1 homeobox domain-containing protein [Nocardia higoensis]